MENLPFPFDRRVWQEATTLQQADYEVTKTKGGFPNENSLLKLLYLGIQNASKK